MPRILLAPVAGAVCLTLFVQTALAEDNSSQDAPLENLIVSATRIATPASQVGSSVTVITAADIAAEQLRTVADALRQVPGVNVVQSGGPGGQTSIFIRGTNSNHTKVLLDGIDIGDPSNPTGAAEVSATRSWLSWLVISGQPRFSSPTSSVAGTRTEE